MGEMVDDEECEDVNPGCPYIEFGAKVHYKEEVPPTERLRA